MGLYLFAPPLAGNGPLINALGLSGVVAIVVGIRMHRPRARAAWWLFAAGQFLFFTGDLYTYSYPKLFGADVQFPSIGDALYLAVYPVLMAGLFVLIKRRNPRPDRSALIDALILTIGVGLLSWVFLIAPNVHLSGLSWLAKGVSVAYPLGDVLLLAAAGKHGTTSPRLGACTPGTSTAPPQTARMSSSRWRVTAQWTYRDSGPMVSPTAVRKAITS